MPAPTHDPGDLEQYAGEVLRDPWNDDAQTDWPNHPLPEDEEGIDGVESGPRTERPTR